MIKSSKHDGFEPCPEYAGRAVCVDVTPLRQQRTSFGERKVFKLVFEVDADRIQPLQLAGRYPRMWSVGILHAGAPRHGWLDPSSLSGCRPNVHTQSQETGVTLLSEALQQQAVADDADR